MPLVTGRVYWDEVMRAVDSLCEDAEYVDRVCKHSKFLRYLDQQRMGIEDNGEQGTYDD